METTGEKEAMATGRRSLRQERRRAALAEERAKKEARPGHLKKAVRMMRLRVPGCYQCNEPKDHRFHPQFGDSVIPTGLAHRIKKAPLNFLLRKDLVKFVPSVW